MPAGGAAGVRAPGVWLSETGGAFACSCPCGGETLVAFARAGRGSTETGIAFARAGRGSTETVIAFAGEKWVFFVCFLVAEVLSVSTVAVQGRAKVMAVSRWPASAVAEASLVATSPRDCALCAKKFAPSGLMWVRARKSSPSERKMAQNRRFMARWANYFADSPLEARCWASFFAEVPTEGACWANFFAGVGSKASYWVTCARFCHSVKASAVPATGIVGA